MAKVINITDIIANIQTFSQQEVEKVKYIARKELKRRKNLADAEKPKVKTKK